MPPPTVTVHFPPLAIQFVVTLGDELDRPSVAEMVADDRVQQKLVGPVAAAGRPAIGPDVVDDGAEHPRALVLVHKCRRRAEPHLLTPSAEFVADG